MQHLLSKEKFTELKNAYIKYNSSFDENEQQTLRAHTQAIWDKLCDEYFQTCKQDSRWVELRKLIKDYEINEYSPKTNQKLTKLDHKKYTFKKGLKIEKIKNDLKEQELIVQKDDELEKSTTLKKQYLVTNTTDYKLAKVEFDKLSKQHANQIIAKALEENVGIICIEHNSYSRSNDGFDLDSSYLNNACNDVRDIVMEMIILNKEADHENQNNLAK